MKTLWHVEAPTEYTLNDIDISFDKTTKKYKLGLEANVYFENDRTAEQSYIKSLLDQFTSWMKSNKFNTDYKLALADVFTNRYSIYSEFDSIEEIYAYFKLLVNGFLTQ